MDDSGELRFVDRRGIPFPGRYTKAVKQLWGLFRRTFSQIVDPTDRDRIIEKTLSRVADHEKRKGQAEHLPSLIWRILPQVAISMLRTNHYKVETISFDKAKRERLLQKAKVSERQTKRRFAAELLQACSEREALILHLRAVMGLEYEEIASQLGLTKENVRQIVHRAKEKLQRSLEGDGSKGGKL